MKFMEFVFQKSTVASEEAVVVDADLVVVEVAMWVEPVVMPNRKLPSL